MKRQQLSMTPKQLIVAAPSAQLCSARCCASGCSTSGSWAGVQERCPGTSRRCSGSLLPDELGLVKTDDGLGQGVVIGIATRTDRAHRAGVGEALGVARAR